MKKLVLGEYDSDPNSVYIFSSSFISHQEVFLEGTFSGLYLPISLGKADFLRKHKETIEIFNHYLPEIAQYLNQQNGLNYSSAFWHPFVSFWMVTVIDLFIDKQLKFNLFFEKFDEPLCIDLFECENDFIFSNDSAFNYGHATSFVFEQIFSSDVLKSLNLNNENIKQSTLGVVRLAHPNAKDVKLKKIEKRIEHVAGFNSVQIAILETLLNLKDLFKRKKEIPPEYKPKTSEKFSVDWMKIFSKYMPKSYLDLDPSQLDCKFSTGEVIFSSYKNFMEKRMLVGLLRENGVRVLLVQHGCNYGDQLTATRNYITEYLLGGFISWGWHSHEHHPARIIPLPSPIMSKLKWRRWLSPFKRKKIILISSVYAPNDNAGSFETADFYQEYYKNICLFLEGLDSKTREHFYFRPRLTHGEVTFNNALVKLVKEKFPWVRILEGSLDREMLKASIIVHDNFGSALQKSLILSPVTLYFWRKNSFILTDKLQATLNEIEKVNGYFSSGKEAAEEVNRIIREGLNNPSLIRLNREFGNHFYKTSLFPLFHWIKALWFL